jgi:glycosyltransferase involved in cell wall biosynthesis
MKYKVSVLIVNYNNAPTLKRAIESVLCQATSFPYEIIVVDDGSTDGSEEFLRSYENNSIALCYYKGMRNFLIALFKHQGIMKTYRDGFRFCKGEYLAICDSDDYFCDVNKLQKQVDYMDSNQDCGICYTKTYTEIGYQRYLMGHSSNYLDSHLTFDDILRGRAEIHSPSMMIRKRYFDKFVKFEKFIKWGMFVWDLPIVLTFVKHCNLRYIDSYSAVWSKLPESFTQTRSKRKKLKLVFGYSWIKLWFVLRYGCKPSTLIYLIYRFFRDITSASLGKWNKR